MHKTQRQAGARHILETEEASTCRKPQGGGERGGWRDKLWPDPAGVGSLDLAQKTVGNHWRL